MTLATLTAWILSLLIAAQPHAPASLLATYPATAEAMARVVLAEPPLFAGPHGREETAALLVETAVEESALRPDAVGDSGRSLCMVQLGASNLRALNLTKRQVLDDLDTCLRAGLAMMRDSMRVCHGRPADEQLAAYVSDGRVCAEDGVPVRRSRYRMHRAMRLLKEHPPPEATPPS